MSRKFTLVLMLGLVLFLCVTPAFADDYPDADCLDCHGDPDGDGPVVDITEFAGSIHEDLSCTDCHTGITELPHEDIEIGPPACADCHDDVADTYVQHGLGVVGKSPYVPTCSDCHGSHHILAHDDKDSSVSPRNMPGTCAKCHEDQAFLAKVGIRFKHPVEVYQQGVHGHELPGVKASAATCNDCHGTGGDAHQILPPGDTKSSINFFNISKTCGQCHETIMKEYEKGIHGQLIAKGDVDAPTCTHCHGEHGILPTNDPRSPVSPFRVAESTCTPCHDSANLNERYELPTGTQTSFVDSYHGLKSQAGDTKVANCASCHGAHLILPSDDKDSSVNPANLAKTCGHCHAGITEETASQTLIHTPLAAGDVGLPSLFKKIYLILIAVVIGGMFFYCLLDWLRQVRNVLAKQQVRRMEVDEVLQHAVLAISFTVLVVTGFALRFYDAWWAHLIFGYEGGAHLRGMIHRIAAGVMVFGAFWHLGYLMTTKGRVFLRDMAPNLNDVVQAIGMFKYNLGLSNKVPEMRRFCFVEKAEYWALIWGTIAMVLTGASLWFERYIIQYTGKEVIEIFHVVHYYEAWLAFLAILIWHMYGVLFNPHVYPMNPSWINGKMPKEMFEHEHPAAISSGNVDKVKRLGLERDV